MVPAMAYRPATFELGRQLRLRAGVTPDRAVEVLRERINALDNLRLDGRNADAVTRSRDDYLTWAEEAEISSPSWRMIAP